MSDNLVEEISSTDYWGGEPTIVMVIDETYCAVGAECSCAEDDEGTLIGPYLTMNPNDGGDDAAWRACFEVKATGLLVCEDCAGCIEDGSLDPVTLEWKEDLE